MMTYNVKVKYENATIDFGTHDINVAIKALFDYVETGAQVDVWSGITGEVVASVNCEEPFVNDEWSLLILGWLMSNAWGE